MCEEQEEGGRREERPGYSKDDYNGGGEAR